MTKHDWNIITAVKQKHADFYTDLSKKYNAADLWQHLNAEQREVYKREIPQMIIGAANEINATANVLRRPQPCTAGEVYWRIKNFCEMAGATFNEKSIKVALNIQQS